MLTGQVEWVAAMPSGVGLLAVWAGGALEAVLVVGGLAEVHVGREVTAQLAGGELEAVIVGREIVRRNVLVRSTFARRCAVRT